MKIVCVFITLIILSSCYGVNEKTSHIGALMTTCPVDSMRSLIKKEYFFNTLTDSTWIQQHKYFANQPFQSHVLYFSEEPKELIGIDNSFSSVRYVYNPKIKDRILDGLDFNLSEKEKKRIIKRVQIAFIKYECEKGKNKAIEYIKNELER